MMNTHKGLELRGFDPSLELDLRAGEFLTHDRQFTPVPTGVGASGHETRQGRREDLRRNAPGPVPTILLNALLKAASER